MIFQGMGAKYTFASAWRHATIRGRQKDREKLKQLIGDVYGGNATLYHKGRSALAEAVRLATGGTGKVAVSGLTCYSVVQAVEAAGCTPLYVDISRESLQSEATQLAAALENHTVKAVIVQHMLGIPTDIDALVKLARKKGIVIIEDLAHSAGASYVDGREVGTVGDYTVLSFGKDKSFDVVNGGALIVRNGRAATEPEREVAKKYQRRDRWYPLIAWVSRKVFWLGPGRYAMGAAIKVGVVALSAAGKVDENETMPTWQARLAIRQVTDRKNTARRRAEVTALYQERLSLELPKGLSRTGAAPIRLPLLIENRDEVIRIFDRNGIIAPDIWYDMPVSTGRGHVPVENYPEDECLVAVEAAEKLINVPTHERITEADIVKITTLVNEVAKQ